GGPARPVAVRPVATGPGGGRGRGISRRGRAGDPRLGVVVRRVGAPRKRRRGRVGGGGGGRRRAMPRPSEVVPPASAGLAGRISTGRTRSTHPVGRVP